MVGERIYRLRKKKGLSQEDLASELGVSRQTISNWESEQTSPDLKQSIKLAQLFEISLDELSGNEKIISLRVETKKEPLSFWKGAVIAITGIFSVSLLFILISALSLLNNVNESMSDSKSKNKTTAVSDDSFKPVLANDRLVCDLVGEETKYLFISEESKISWSEDSPQEIIDVIDAIEVDENDNIDIEGTIREIESIYTNKGYSCTRGY